MARRGGSARSPYVNPEWKVPVGSEQILAGFVRDGDTVVIEAAPNGEGVTLTTEPSEGERTATNGRATTPVGEA
jgi:hypothetical protein